MLPPPQGNPSVNWFTLAKKVDLFFRQKQGTHTVHTLLWKTDKYNECRIVGEAEGKVWLTRPHEANPYRDSP